VQDRGEDSAGATATATVPSSPGFAPGTPPTEKCARDKAAQDPKLFESTLEAV
jgi:hypothetical protein